jgi:hypothetical protein
MLVTPQTSFNHKKKIEENVTSERVSPSSSTSTPHEHETTFYPPTTIMNIQENTAEITTTTSPSEPSEKISSSTTPRYVDATIAHVATMVDKVEH